jgi:hydroxymethylbilane synthase
MNRLRLSTRSSPLALWQANEVTARLRAQGVDCMVEPLNTTGDVDLVSPIYEMGVEGVFTRELDIAVLNGKADIAVHSLKDMPVVPAKGLVIAAVLERGAHEDLLIHKGAIDFEREPFTVATSSIRRRAQWLQRYPRHQTANIRGNIQTRIDKLESSDWNGMIMAKAAYDRLELNLESTVLGWMLPAPGQGAIAVACRNDDRSTREILATIDHRPTNLCVTAERQFLRELKGGCSAPISALATISARGLYLKAALHSIDGSRHVSYEKQFSLETGVTPGQIAADEVLQQPLAKSILKDIYRDRPGLML